MAALFFMLQGQPTQFVSGHHSPSTAFNKMNKILKYKLTQRCFTTHSNQILLLHCSVTDGIYQHQAKRKSYKLLW